MNYRFKFQILSYLIILFWLSLRVNAQEDYNLVTKVVDGDTFEIETGDRVRLLGIDTPEKWKSGKLDKDAKRNAKDKEIIQKLGQLASEYAEKILLNQKVKLVPDSTNADKDRYGRLLRYAYLEDGTFFNLKIIQDGYAYAYTKYPVTYEKEFLEAQREARENNRGLWGDVDFKEMK
jgi:micrococcal nuclease